MDQEVRGGQDNSLLIGSHEVSVVEVTFKMILKKPNIAARECHKQVTVTSATHGEKHGNFIFIFFKWAGFKIG